MPRPKKQAPNHASGMYEYKATIGKDFMGKPIRKSFYSPKSLDDAKAKAQMYIIEQEVSDRTGETFIQKEYTFAQWAEKWLEVYKKPTVSENTYRLTYLNSVEKHLNPFFGAAALTDIRSADVQRFFNQKQKDLSESMLDKLHMTLYGIFDTAIDNDLCYKNPVKGIKYVSRKDKTEKHVYSDDEIKIAKAFFKDAFPEAYVMLETGLRRGEVAGLMWSDIDTNNLTLSVNRSIADKIGGGVEVRPPKWNSYRTIPITAELVSTFNSLPRTGLYIFMNDKKQITSPSYITHVLKRYMKQLHDQSNLPELTAHELRHTRGTELRRNGVDIYTIQKLMGHKDINVTANIYVHDDVETTRKAAKIS
ncbi:MAG: tyrosine-type recombinase/integrase [Huintestinicola sp.]